MNKDDIIRYVGEYLTITAQDLASDFEIVISAANQELLELTQKKYLERLKVGKTFIYTLAKKGQQALTRIKPIDPDERCLPLERIVDPFGGLPMPQCSGCGGVIYPGDGVFTQDAYGNWSCRACGRDHRFIDVNDDIPF